MCVRTLAVSSNIPFITQAQEILRGRIKATGAATSGLVLTPQTARSDGNIKVDPDAILGHLIKGRSNTKIPPVNASISGAMLQHHPQRLAPLGIIAAARPPPQTRRALGQVPTQIARRVACRVALLWKSLAKSRLRLHDHLAFAAVEEQVIVL